MTKETKIDDLYHLDYSIKTIFNRFDSVKTEKVSLEDSNLEEGFIDELARVFTYEKAPLVESLKEFSTKSILDYLRNTHTYYIEKKLPEMENLTFALCKSSDKKMCEVLHFFFSKFSSGLKKHIEYEETYAFPYIANLDKGIVPRLTANSFRVTRFIEAHNHETEDQLGDFSEHLNTTFSSLKNEMPFKHFLQHMVNFERDLRIHGAIEDDILIPRALELEYNLLSPK